MEAAAMLVFSCQGAWEVFYPLMYPKLTLEKCRKKRNSIDFRLEIHYYYLIFIITLFQKGTYHEWERNYYSTQ